MQAIYVTCVLSKHLIKKKPKKKHLEELTFWIPSKEANF